MIASYSVLKHQWPPWSVLLDTREENPLDTQNLGNIPIREIRQIEAHQNQDYIKVHVSLA